MCHNQSLESSKLFLRNCVICLPVLSFDTLSLFPNLRCFLIFDEFFFQAQNGDYFSQYLTEDISEYVARKRYLGVHGNHLEIQALSEMYNRPIHIYCYSAEPINTFQVSKSLYFELGTVMI